MDTWTRSGLQRTESVDGRHVRNPTKCGEYDTMHMSGRSLPRKCVISMPASQGYHRAGHLTEQHVRGQSVSGNPMFHLTLLPKRPEAQDTFPNGARHCWWIFVSTSSIASQSKQFYVYVYFACMHLCVLCMLGPTRARRSIRSLELEMAVSCHCQYWEVNLGPL